MSSSYELCITHKKGLRNTECIKNYASVRFLILQTSQGSVATGQTGRTMHKTLGGLMIVLGLILMGFGFAASGAPSGEGTLNIGLLTGKIIVSLCGAAFFVSGTIVLSAAALWGTIHRLQQARQPPDPGKPSGFIATLSGSNLADRVAAASAIRETDDIWIRRAEFGFVVEGPIGAVGQLTPADARRHEEVLRYTMRPRIAVHSIAQMESGPLIAISVDP